MKATEVTEVEAALRVLVDADVEGADRDGLRGLAAGSGRVRSWLDRFDVRCARRSKALVAEGSSGGPQSDLGNGGQRSGKETAAITDREAVCEAMPGFEAALESGAVGAGHVDAIANATRRLDDELQEAFAGLEDELLAAASSERVEAFERRCRETVTELQTKQAAESDAAELDEQRRRSSVRRWTDQRTGMCHTHLELDPLRDAAIHSAVDAQLARLRQEDGNARTPWGQLQVNAWVAAVSKRSGGSGEDGDETTDDSSPGLDRVPEATLLVDLQTLVDGLHEHSVCELEDGTSIPVSTMRRLLCDCEVLPAVLNERGEVLDAGRTRRTATRPQRRALRAMHRTCAHPECTVPFGACRIHHVRWWWEHTGPTNIDNLLPLCEQHHHLVHEGGWTLTMTPDRTATWRLPDGSLYHKGSTIDRAPNGVGRPDAASQPKSRSRPRAAPATAGRRQGTVGSNGSRSTPRMMDPVERERPPP